MQADCVRYLAITPQKTSGCSLQLVLSDWNRFESIRFAKSIKHKQTLLPPRLQVALMYRP